MSEVIVRMEMPLNCEHCPMSHWNKLNELTGCDAVGGNAVLKGVNDNAINHLHERNVQIRDS